jgi:hypothetical protein
LWKKIKSTTKKDRKRAKKEKGVKVSLIPVDLELLPDEVKCCTHHEDWFVYLRGDILSLEVRNDATSCNGALLNETVFSVHLIVAISRYLSTYISYFMCVIEAGIQHRAILTSLRVLLQIVLGAARQLEHRNRGFRSHSN